jgi:Family of unknown function (DUF5678)
MPRVKSKATDAAEAVPSGKAAKKSSSSPDVIRREYAGKYVAWAPDGLRIVAVGSSFEAAERKAAKAGYPQVAVARIPKGRMIHS